MKTIFIAMLVTVFAGCASVKPPVIPGTLEGVKTEVNIDPRLLEDCDPLSDIDSNVRPSDVLDQHAKDVKVVNCLRSKNKALVKTMKEAFNLKDAPK
jgi:hypothetical protein